MTILTKQGLLILAHGSRDPGARSEYLQVAEALGARLPGVPLQFGILEFPGEDVISIDVATRRLAEAGAQRIVALPYFLFAAGHVREDLPGELEQAVADLPGVQVAYQPPIGVDLALLDALIARADEAASNTDISVDGPTALLLVGAGTSDPDANADIFRAARLIWERRRYPLVEVAFVSLTEPSVADGLRRCQVLGARRVVVVPYFLNTGVLSRRIAARIERARPSLGDLDVVLAREAGLHPALLDRLAKRARQALAASWSTGLDLPPCAVKGGAWACWLDRLEAPSEAPAPL